MSTDIKYSKGHGTHNDFVLIPDLDDEIDFSVSQIQQICNRKDGLGADGILRVAKLNNDFFMDYRNSDGTIAEMCGNGARVFALFLSENKLIESNNFSFQTRAGKVDVELRKSDEIRVSLSKAILRGKNVEVSVNGKSYDAQAVDAPNPHAVAFVQDLAEVGPLSVAPTINPKSEFENGVNVEFVKILNPDHVAMRVHERGSGETQSCGTGACAVAAVVRQESNNTINKVMIDLPGGRLIISFENEKMIMQGPAVLQESGILPEKWYTRK
jgi:diaminopimelate epimerase